MTHTVWVVINFINSEASVTSVSNVSEVIKTEDATSVSVAAESETTVQAGKSTESSLPGEASPDAASVKTESVDAGDAVEQRKSQASLPVDKIPSATSAVSNKSQETLLKSQATIVTATGAVEETCPSLRSENETQEAQTIRKINNYHDFMIKI